jgi:hypothetical protein
MPLVGAIACRRVAHLKKALRIPLARWIALRLFAVSSQ